MLQSSCLTLLSLVNLLYSLLNIMVRLEIKPIQTEFLFNTDHLQQARSEGKINVQFIKRSLLQRMYFNIWYGLWYILDRQQYNKMHDKGNEQGLGAIQDWLDLYSRLLLKEDSCKIELDGSEGQAAFRQFMIGAERLIKITAAVCTDRAFRSNYSSAYKVLYTEGSLGYIPEIYDSAQEGFPFIYVNGDRHDFSCQALHRGERLVDSLSRVVHECRVACLRREGWIDPVRLSLQEFDASWAQYEMQYIKELIDIERVAKGGIRAIIERQQALLAYQNDQKLRGRIFLSGPQYGTLRKQLCEQVGKLNAIANTDGKGRDDLTVEVLEAAENVLATVTERQARSVRVLAEKIRESFQNVREVLRFFGENFELVDPQLKNNPELVLALQQYECHWEKGKRYFLQPKKEHQIVAFSTIVDAATQKYPTFQELLDYSDPSIFWILPSLVVLRSLQQQDQGLAESFLSAPQAAHKYPEYLRLKQVYITQKKRHNNSFQVYNKLQQLLITQGTGQEEMGGILNKVKELAVSLERVSPLDWNDMLGVLLLDNQ